ncbi:glycosyl hydrolase family 28-related protein [Megasphaera sp. SC8-1]|uniref:glycosyl hydrolase family 28-related protein n=1 Tax=Megasphaera sp. SC8-1 TaxID=2965102 RepID=UPI002108B59F|nr:glycosyl hydrolase family 28-related protein [Megasphaera sp. SC8-1]MCQ4113696.1 phage tail protein [Megasphaera sp. SC8-1]
MNFTTGYILTKAGEALHAKVEAGTTLKLTKMQLGSGTVTTVDDYYERSALVEPQNAMSIAEIQQVTAEKNMCVATAVLTNAAVDTSYMASELGLFAQNTDGTEILYAVSYDDHPSYIASKNDGTDITMKFSMYIVATSEITITLTLPKTAEEIATVAAGYAAKAAESEAKAKQLEATANNYLQTTQQAMTLANGYANISKAWAEGNASPDEATDTDSPTGYTQSAKIWAALSREYAGMSKFKLPIGYYNSVAEMRKSETAIVGRPCVTLGYYQPNDGGGSVYLIRAKTDNDQDDGGSIIFLDNGNIAELIIDGAINVKRFGAKGNGSTDDTITIQNAINYAYSKGRNADTQEVNAADGKILPKIIFPVGEYVTSTTLHFDKSPCFLNLDMSNATLKYTGSDYAILFRRLRNSHLNLGFILASNGGGIHFLVRNDDPNDWMQYVHTTFNCISCKETGVLAECSNPQNKNDTESWAPWLNAMYFYGGRFMNCKIGFHVKSENAANIHGWNFFNCTSEHSVIGFKLENASQGNTYALSNFSFFGCYKEDVDEHSFQTVGKVKSILWIKADNYTKDNIPFYFNLSDDTKDFVILPQNSGKEQIKAGDDFNNYTNKGKYYVKRNEDMWHILNVPKITSTDVCDAGLLIVTDLTSSDIEYVIYNIVQIFIEYTFGRIFRRTKPYSEDNNSKWSEWSLITTPINNLMNVYKKGETANDLIVDGEYIAENFDKDVTLTNLPEQKAGRLVVESIARNAYYTYQTYYTFDGKVWMRLFNRSNNSWTKWKLLINLQT